MLRYPITGSYRCLTVASTSTAPSPTKVPPTTTNSTTTTTPFRVAGITIRNDKYNTADAPADHVAMLQWALDPIVCVVCNDSDYDIPASALMMIDMTFPYWRSPKAAISGLLATKYPALVRSLRVLKIKSSPLDESAALGAFAALATDLRELTFRCCGLSSVRDMEGRCEYLRKVDLCGCKFLSSIDALRSRVHLEEVDVSWTPIPSIEPLRSCPALTKVDIDGCEMVPSVEALEGHQRLQVVSASRTPLPSIEPLRTCPNLKTVNITGCRQLPAENVGLPTSVNIIRGW